MRYPLMTFGNKINRVLVLRTSVSMLGFLAGISLTFAILMLFTKNGELRWIFQTEPPTAALEHNDPQVALDRTHESIGHSSTTRYGIKQSVPVPEEVVDDLALPVKKLLSDHIADRITANRITTPEIPLPSPEPHARATQSPSETLIPIENLNTTTRNAVVNILCTTLAGGSFHPITATGIIIDPRGIILTNAHVAQYLLLARYVENNAIDCVIRTGSPAQAKYRADVLYISPSWIEENSRILVQENPIGTGENDFALLLITETISGDSLASRNFSTLHLEPESASAVQSKDTILIAGYPAGFLGGISVQKDLHIASTISEIGQLFTFESGSIDLFSLGGTVLSQKGASGGAVVRQKTGKLAGMVVTSSEGATTDDRDLRAISIAHINTVLKRETGISLYSIIGQDASKLNIFFENKAADLAKKLIDALQSSS